MRRKPRIVFNPIGDSAPLSIYWHSGPYGEAKEAKNGEGIYWQSPNGELLGVQFDDVDIEKDSQQLVIEGQKTVTVTVRQGKVEVSVLDWAA